MSFHIGIKSLSHMGSAPLRRRQSTQEIAPSSKGLRPFRTDYQRMRYDFRCLMILLTIVVGFVGDLYAQATIGSVSPRSCQLGETTRLTVSGKGFVEGMKIVASHRNVTVTAASIEAEKLVLDITTAADTVLGPMGIWLASHAGPAEPLVVIVDDLPTVVSESTNVAPESAQAVSTLVGIDGTSKGAQSSFYKFDADAGQRVAFEIVTQSLESKMDPVMRLINAAGETLVLADDDEISSDCRFDYRFAEAGAYWIEVRDNRYTAGGHYRLRIGDFPILRHAFPLTVRAGEKTELQLVGPDADTAIRQNVEFPIATGDAVTTVATRLPEGRSSAWVPLRVTTLPQIVETPPQGEPQTGDATTPQPLTFPLVINGQLTEAQQKDRYSIQGIKGTTVRFLAQTRSLGCPTILRMQLLGDKDAQVAQAKVGDADEWSFDFAFPDDRVYQLEVTDLLGRGGNDFGYCVEVVPAGSFDLRLKPDAAVKNQFAIETGHGAAAIDLQIQRFGFDGEIDLSLDKPVAGLRILNPRIAAKVNDVRLYLVADAAWPGESLELLRIRGEAVGQGAINASLASIDWQRIKIPHVPFPAHWRSGLVTLAGAAKTDPYFGLEPATSPLRLARPVARHEALLSLKRMQEGFKAGVVVMADPAAPGWPLEVKNQADAYTVAWTRPAEAAIEAAAQPQSFRLLAFAEHQNRGRLETIDLPLEWFDPVSVQLGPETQSRGGQIVDIPLVAGSKAKMKVSIARQGDDPQPIKLTFAGLADLKLTGPEVLEIAADNDSAEFELAVSADLTAQSAWRFPFEIASSYKGQAFTIAGQSAPMSVIAAPVSIDVFPQEIHLVGAKDRHQVVVTGSDDIGVPRDWTREAILTTANAAIAEIRGTTVFAKSDGETTVIVQVGSHRVEIPLRVSQTQIPKRTAFESEVLVALSKQGCNSGACHGSPSGKGMFRLSLRAFDRQLDELTLIREDYGRRLNPIEPEQSLLLLKPLMKVSHGGGKQLRPDDEAYAILRDWIAAGAPADPADTPRCVRLEVLPSAKRIMQLDSGPQQIAAVAHFSDGTHRDVTHLVAYESSDMSVATVDHSGLVSPIKRGETVILVRFLEHIESVPLMFIQQIPGFVWETPPPANYVDELVNDKLRQLQYVPAATCSDAEFLRRVHLDLIGILPSIETSREFLADQSPDKRSRIIDELLQRDEFAKFWALKWGDLLKMTGKVVGDDGVYKYHRWVEEAFRTNMPYDEFARQLLTTSGSTLANPPANFYRTATDMNECVENVSQVFLGARLQCAKCHNHPFERWTQDNYYGLGAFFNRVERRKTQRPGEMFVWTSSVGDVVQPRTGERMKPWLPVQGSVDIDDSEDRRDTFAQWLVDPSNPYFSRMEVNRIWAQLFSRGIVDPIDDFRDSNPPSNEALLDALAKDFSEAGFDRKHILRVILNSRTYQASYQTNDLNRDDSLYFSHQRPRLLSAEQLLDAINHATGLDQKFGNLPSGTRATHLPAPDIVKIDFLRVFGQPERTTVCACERVDDSNLGMAIELFNGTTIHEKLRAPGTRFRLALSAGKPLVEVIQEVYLAALCRLPSEHELKAATDHCEKREDVAAGLEDVCWALLNTDEFLFQH